MSAFVKTGSLLSLKKISSESQRDMKAVSGFVSGMDAGGQSVGGGPSVPSQRLPKDFIGTACLAN